MVQAAAGLKNNVQTHPLLTNGHVTHVHQGPTFCSRPCLPLAMPPNSLVHQPHRPDAVAAFDTLLYNIPFILMSLPNLPPKPTNPIPEIVKPLKDFAVTLDFTWQALKYCSDETAQNSQINA